VAVGGNQGGAGGAANLARAQRKPKRRSAPKASPPARTPSSAQVEAARAQEQQYKSQGVAVQRTAKRQQAAARTRHREVKDTKGAGDLQRARGQVVVRNGHVFTFKPAERGLTVTKKIDGVSPTPGGRPGQWVTVDHGHERGMTVGEANPSRAAHQASVVAPALKVLDQTTRPAHAIAGAAYAGVTGKDVLKGALRGAELKDRHLFGDVLRKAGVGGPLASIGGFALDVAADPTTYTTLGAGSVAKHAAAKEAERVAAKATRAGMSEAGVRTVSERAGRRAAAAGPAGKGVTVKVAGHEVPGVRRGTAAAGRGAKRVAGKAPGPVKRAGGGMRELAREVRPTMRPAGADEAQHLAARRAARKARAATNQADVDNQAYARALHRDIGPANYEKVIRAIETRTLHRLGDPELHQAAVSLRSRFRHAKRLRSYAGVGEGTIRDYFPHAREDVLESGLGISDAAVEGVGRGGGRTVTRPSSARMREEKRPIHEVNPERVAEGKVPFSTNVPLVALNYGNETARVVAKANLIKDLAGAGRRVRPGRDLDLKDGEAVYRLGFEPGGRSSVPLRGAKGGAEVVLRSARGRGTFGLREVDDREVQRVLGGQPGQGQYVVLNRKVVEDAVASAKPAQSTKTSARVFDRAQGTWKRVATSTPGFHIRNLLGDTQMAYLEQPGHKLPRNIGQAGKAVRRDSQQARLAGRTTATQAASKKTIKVAGKRMPLDEFIAGARKHGVLDTGYVGRQLEDLTNPAGVSGAARVKRGAGGRVKRWMRNRENLLRVATYKHGLDRGLSEAEAADLSMSIHIDYGDITETERTFGRRVAPFYTFTARAAPLHAKKLVTNPGKFANTEKLREEVGQAFGGGGSEEEQRGRMQEYQQRQLPFVIKIGGGPKAISFAPPMNLLNELPTSTNPSKYLDELGKFGFAMVSPALKTPVELYSNTSFYFRKPIEDKNRPLVAAPGWVAHLPEGLKTTLDVTPNYVDPRTGKKVWGWRGRADYLAKLFPGPINLAQQLATSGTNRRGQGEVGKVVAGLSGVRADPLDEVAAQAAKAVGIVKRLAVLNRRAGELNQQGVDAEHATPEYRKIRGEINQLGKVLDASHRSGQAGAKPDPETEKLLREARQEGAAAAPSADEVQKLLREAGVR
jgi:hypothetical protein